jgi:hypothetical protein
MPFSGFCHEYEILCTTTVTVKPAETLKMLAAAMPKGAGKKYRVTVSVEPLED